MQDLGFFIVYIVDIHEFQILHELRILYEIQSLHERSVNRESNFWYSQFFQKMNENLKNIILYSSQNIFFSFVFARIENSKNCFRDLLHFISAQI